MYQKDRNIRKLTRIGKRSIGLTLPINDVRALGWQERRKLSVRKIKGGFVIRDQRKK